MPQKTHYYIFFAEEQLEVFEFRLQELLAFCRRRGWSRPFVSKVLITEEELQIMLEGPGIEGLQVQKQRRDIPETG